MTRRVLVSGAGVAGAALAHWLTGAGWQVTVDERSEQVRNAGQNVDIRGAGREVVRRMGLEQRLLDEGTGEVGTRFIDSSGRPWAEFPAGRGESDGATAEMEILRGTLTEVLVEHSADATYVFGDRIESLTQDSDGVRASFTHGDEQSVDAVIIAEGMRSHARSLLWPDVDPMRRFSAYMAWATIDRTDTDDRWWRWYNAPGGRVVTLRPDNVGTTRATLTFLDKRDAIETESTERQLAVLREKFGDVGWEARRILAGLEGNDGFYLEPVAQVHMPSWTSGRIALLGDAAHAPSPITGMGTTLALVGAYVLAGELTSTDSIPDALRAYERRMRPFVKTGQKVPPGGPRLAHPRSRLGVLALRLGAAAVASRPVRTVTAMLSGRSTHPADTFDLPDYPALDAAGSRRRS